MSNNDWKPVHETGTVCPICGKPDWCGISRCVDYAICMRVPSERPTRNGGYLHRLREPGDLSPKVYVRTIREPETEPVSEAMPINWDLLTQRHCCAISDRMRDALANDLGVSPDSLRSLRIGWDEEAVTFPMVDHAGEVCGIRRRLPSGRKFAFKGSRNGLFVPCFLEDDIEIPNPEILCIAEGESDCAALLTLGFAAIGRPGCRGGGPLVCEHIHRREPDVFGLVVIVADHDRPGREGARDLAELLTLRGHDTKIIEPPDGIKDVREWLRIGATYRDVIETIDAAPLVEIAIESIWEGGF